MKKIYSPYHFPVIINNLPKGVFWLFSLFMLISNIIEAQTVIGASPYIVPASGNYTIPYGITSITIEAYGGGGGGGGSAGTAISGTNRGCGGGGGAYQIGTLNNLVSGGVYTITVGAGGTRGSNANGGAGGKSEVTGAAGTITANGGGGGIRNGGGLGNGASGTLGGGNGACGSGNAGGGGGGAGNAAAGTSASASTGGAGGAGGGGKGGDGAGGTNDGQNGADLGGGGGGGRSSGFFAGARSGGLGGAGRVVITYSCLTPTIGTLPAAACQGETITITGTNFAQGGTTVTFNGGPAQTATVNATGTSLDVTIPTNATSGNIVVTTCTSSAGAAYTVNPLPNVIAPTAEVTPICLGTGTNIQISSSATGIDYLLRNNVGNVAIPPAVGGNGGTINLPTGNLAAATTFNVLATNATTGCSKLMTPTAVVNLKTNSTTPSITAPTAVVAPGGNVTLTAGGGVSGTGANYHWYTDGCGTTPLATGASVNVTPAANTTYYVRREDDCINTTCATFSVSISLPTCGITYVSTLGNDITNNGSADFPYATLNKAVANLNGGNRVLVATGNYSFDQRLSLPANIIIEGGYDEAANWKKLSNGVTSITFTDNAVTGPGLKPTTTEVDGNTRQLIGIAATANGWTLQDLTITTGAVTGTATNGPGSSNYALWINGSNNYNIIRCHITSGAASAGANGTGFASNGGTGGSPGGNGGGGKGGDFPNTVVSNPGLVGNIGAAGTDPGVPGVGGDGGNPGLQTGTVTVTLCGAGQNGPTGNDGGTGSAGKAWVPLNRPTATLLPANLYFVPSQAESGGGGGGGGSGSGGGGNCGGSSACVNCGGVNGGNGGAGGKGGGGGNGGFGAGGSFAIWQYNTSGGIITQTVAAVPGSVASGGTGNVGEIAPNTGKNVGRQTTSNNICFLGTATRGGDGGNGGNGGNGGRGRDGANGVNSAVVTDGVAGTLIATIPNAPVVSVLYDNVKACRNSEITITKASGTWTLPSGLDYVNDKTIGSSSYIPTSPTIRVYSTSVSTPYTLISPLDFNSFIRTDDDARTASTLSPITSICLGVGTTINCTATDWAGGNHLAYEWSIFTTDANAPLLSSTASDLVNFDVSTLSAGTYNVRYRVKDQCCGWSIPVYTSFNVNPATNFYYANDACFMQWWQFWNNYSYTGSRHPCF